MMTTQLIIICTYLFLFSHSGLKHQEMVEKRQTEKFRYKVKQARVPAEINSDWKKNAWSNIESLSLKNHMGDLPAHFPETQVKLSYDRDNIYVIFKVINDQYIKAVANEIHGKVWQDSCVEFFFTPGKKGNGYFNLETNCKGIFLFGYHNGDGGSDGYVEIEDCEKIEIAHSLKKDVRKELEGPETWTIEYRIPVAILSKYMEIDQPGPGVEWKANFYKCADNTSHPHWLTWAKVDHPTPKFHLPEFFGTLKFK